MYGANDSEEDKRRQRDNEDRHQIDNPSAAPMHGLAKYTLHHFAQPPIADVVDEPAHRHAGKQQGTFPNQRDIIPHTLFEIGEGKECHVRADVQLVVQFLL
jgi:hypothetical protein